MKLKLAEYKDEKFERFLEFGKDFIFGGDFIGVYPQSAWQAIKKSTIFSSDNFYKFDKDEKDPLNRLNGLFDGITYGQGRFILIENIEDFIVWEIKEPRLLLLGRHSMSQARYAMYKDCISGSLIKNMGNIIENPELWEKIK